MHRSKIYLPDVNVWLALVDEAHFHHAATLRWLARVGYKEASFCRITQMALLRLLTNRRVMGSGTLNQTEAWRIYQKTRSDERVLFLDEPEGIEDRWRELTRRGSPSNSLWTDCYLRAFADVRGLTVVTFDRTFAESSETETLVLR